MEQSKPILKLTGTDGNVFSIMGRAVRTLRNAKYPQEKIDTFVAEMKSGDYGHALRTCMKWFDVR